MQRAVFRILQEALTNAIRHGDGSGVAVTITWRADAVALGVRNGIRPDAAPPEGGHGIVGMRERAHLVGGRLDAGAEGGQWVVRAELPLGGVR